MTAARRAVPTGTVPSLREFTKHVWRYRDENGHTALVAPPEIFTLVLDDQADADVAASAAGLLTGPLGFGDHVSHRFVNGFTHVGFTSIQAVHAFLQVLSACDHQAANGVAEFVLEMLGFKWTAP